MVGIGEASYSTIAPTIHTFFNNLNSTEVATNATTTEANAKAMEEESMQVKRVAMLVAELFGLSILMLSNVTGIQALRRAEAYLLVPWLFVYIIGICRYSHRPEESVLIQLHCKLFFSF